MHGVDIFGLMTADYTRQGLDTRARDIIAMIRQRAAEADGADNSDGDGGLTIPEEGIDTWIILGTGWADQVPLTVEWEAPLRELGLFRALPEHATHKRVLQIGTIEVDGAPRRVGVLRGRIHLNEANMKPHIFRLVRLQFLIMIYFGAKHLITTSACGGCVFDLNAGTVAVISQFLDYSNTEVMPVEPDGVFPRINDAIASNVLPDLPFRKVKHMFWLGPHFETPETKRAMANMGADVVGMSAKPAAAVVSECLLRQQLDPTAAKCNPGLRVIPLVHVSNGLDDDTDDEKHRARAKQDANVLAEALVTTLRACV